MTEREREALRADLSAYLDGELDTDRTRAVEAWLAESNEARELLDELRDVTDHLAALPRRQAPDALAATMTRQAELRLLLSEQTPSSGRGWRIVRRGLGVSASAAVVLMCVLVGYVALQPYGTDMVKRSAGARPAPGTGHDPMPGSAPSEYVVDARGRGLSDDAADSATQKQPARSRSALRESAAANDVGGALSAGVGENKTDGTTGGGAITSQTPRLPGMPDRAVPEVAVGGEGATESKLLPGQVAVTEMASVAESPPPLPQPSPPQVQVWVESSTLSEYLDNSVVLSEWSHERVPTPAVGSMTPALDQDAAAMTRSFGQAEYAVARQYRIPAGELTPRLRRLTDNVAEPAQVKVQMNLLADDVEMIAKAVRPPAESAEETEAVLRFSELYVPPTLERAATGQSRDDRRAGPTTRMARQPGRVALDADDPVGGGSIFGLPTTEPSSWVEVLAGFSVSPEIRGALTRLLTGGGEPRPRTQATRPDGARPHEIDLHVILLPPPSRQPRPTPDPRPSPTTQPVR